MDGATVSAIEHDASSGLHGLVMGDDGPIWALDSIWSTVSTEPKPKGDGSTAPSPMPCLPSPSRSAPLR